MLTFVDTALEILCKSATDIVQKDLSAARAKDSHCFHVAERNADAKWSE